MPPAARPRTLVVLQNRTSVQSALLNGPRMIFKSRLAIERVFFAASAFLLVACTNDAGRPQGFGITVDTVRVLTYNIHHGEGVDEILDLERIASIIREVDPDLVALQEVDSVAFRTGRIDQAAELARLTELPSVFGAFMPYDGGAYGMALLSRWPLMESVNLRLPDGAEPRTALSATVTSPKTGRALRFVGIHLYQTDAERLAQAVRLEALLDRQEMPTILAGDFNSTPSSEVMARLGESWTIVAKGADHLTFPSYAPEREIDFVLVQPSDRFDLAEQRLMDEPVASDHRPVVVDLVFRD